MDVNNYVLQFSEALSGFQNVMKTLESSLASQNKELRRLTRALTENQGDGAAQTLPPLAHERDDALAVRADKVEVFTRVVFMKLGEIDTIKESFSADVFVQAFWREPKLDALSQTELDSMDVSRYWNPKLFVENLEGNATRQDLWYLATKDTGGQAYIHERRRLKGRFAENIELHQFPLDTQHLSVTVKSERPYTELSLQSDESTLCSINVQSFVDKQEWKLHDHVELSVPNRDTTSDGGPDRLHHPSLTIFCRATRKPGFFLWNIVLIMIFICSLAFGTFAVDVQLPQNRLQLSFTLVLTMITFKFTVSQSLPKISYLTFLDRYVLTSMLVLCLICAWHASVSVVERYTSLSTAEYADRVALIVLACVYILCHIVFVIVIYHKARPKQLRYEQKDEEYKERLQVFHDPVGFICSISSKPNGRKSRVTPLL